MAVLDPVGIVILAFVAVALVIGIVALVIGKVALVFAIVVVVVGVVPLQVKCSGVLPFFAREIFIVEAKVEIVSAVVPAVHIV